MSGNKVDYRTALEVASHEAIIRQTYKDSVGKDTWSVGMTNATGHTVQRYIGKPAPLQHCLNLYVWALKKYAAGVNKAFSGHKLTHAQFTAALSFHWNTGAIATASWVNKWKAGDIAGARKAFMFYRKPKSIIGRRTKERDLFFDGKWSNDGTMTECTRLTSRRTPVWKSAVKINVETALKAAFKTKSTVKTDAQPRPDNKPSVPTLSPAPKPVTPTKTPEKPRMPILAAILRLLKQLFKRNSS